MKLAQRLDALARIGLVTLDMEAERHIQKEDSK